MSCISSNFSSFFLNSLNDPSEFSKYLSNGELRFANSNANNNHAINNMPTSTSLLSSAPIVDDFQVHSNHMVITQHQQQQHQQQQHQQQISVNIMPSNHNLNVGIIGNASSQITNAEVTLNNALDNNAGRVNGVDSAGVNAERGFGIGADVPQNITAISTHNYCGNFASNNHHQSAHHLTQQQQQQQQQQQSRWPIPEATSSVIHSHHHQQLSTVHAVPTTGHLGANAQHFDGSFEFLKYLRHSNDFNQEHSNGDIGHDITAAQVAPPKHESMSTTTLNNASNFMDLDNNSNAHKVSRSSHKTNAALLSSITHTLNNNNGTVTPVAGVDAGTAAISTTPTPMIIDMYDHDSKHTTFDLQQHQQQLQQQQQQQQQRMSQHYHIHNSTSVHSSHSSNESSSMEMVTLNYANSQMNASNSNTSEEGGASVNGGGDFSTLTVSNNSSNHSSGSGVIVGTVASAVSPSAPKPLTAFTLKDNFEVHPSHKIEEGIFQHMNKLPPKKKENLKQLGVRFTGQMTVSDKSVIVENFIKFCQEYDIQDHRPFLSLNQSGLNKPEQIKFARYLGQGLPTFTLFCIYSNFKNLFCTKRTEIYTKDGYNLPYILEKTKQFLANTAAGNNNTNVNNTNNTNTSNTNTTNTIASNTNQNTCSSPTTVTTIIMATTTTTTSATITINNHNTVSSNNSIDNNNTNNNNNNNNINNTINIITTKAETTTNPSPPYGTSSVILSSNVASTTIPNNNRMHVTPNIYQGQAVNAVNSSKCNSNSNANKSNNNNNYNNNKFNSSNSNNEINSNKIHNSNNKMHHAIATQQQQQQQQIHNVPLPLSSPLVSIGPTTTIRNPTHILHQPTTQHHNQQQQQQQVIHQHQQQQRQQQPIVNLTPPPTPIPMSTTIQPQHPSTPVHMMVTHQHPNQLHRVHTPMHTNLNQSSHHYHHHHQQQQQKQPSQFTRPQVVIVSQSMAQQQNQPLQHNLSQIAMGPVIAVGGTGNVNASGNGSVTIATPMLLSTQTPIQVTATATVTAAPAAASTNVHIYAPSVTQPPPSPHALSSTSTNLQIQHYQQHHSHPLHISQPVTIYQQQQQQQQQHILSTHSPHHIQQFTHINHHQQHLSAPTHHLIHNVVTPNGAAAATDAVGIGTTIATTVAISTATTRTISSPSQNMINRT